jgi:hypothetical protein
VFAAYPANILNVIKCFAITVYILFSRYMGPGFST